MAASTHGSAEGLSQDATRQLQQLIQVNIDSAKEFQEAAEAITDRTLASEFRVWAADRTRHTDELAEYVPFSKDESPADEQWQATFHQTWVRVRAALSAGSTAAVLSEVEQGQNYVEQRYLTVLPMTAGTAVEGVIQRQYASVKAVHERVRDLRDARAR